LSVALVGMSAWASWFNYYHIELTSMKKHQGADQSELSQFLKDTVESAEAGLKGTKYYVDGSIDFELTVSTIKDACGKFKIFVAEAGANYEKENVSKLDFLRKRKRIFS
jgi:hypothetical protein